MLSKKIKNCLLSFFMFLGILIIFSNNNILDAKAATTYTPYAKNGKVYGVSVGKKIYLGNYFSGKKLKSGEKIELIFYCSKQDANNENSSCTCQAVAKGKKGKVVEQGGTYNCKKGWKIHNISYKRNRIRISLIPNQPATVIKSIKLSYNWKALEWFKLGKHISENDFWDNISDYGYFMSASGTGVQKPYDPRVQFYVKVTEDHIANGYLDEDDDEDDDEYDDEEYDDEEGDDEDDDDALKVGDWASLYWFNENYKFNATDEYAYSIELVANRNYVFEHVDGTDITNHVINPDYRVKILSATSSCYAFTGQVALIDVYLGTGDDIVKNVQQAKCKHSSTTKNLIPATTTENGKLTVTCNNCEYLTTNKTLYKASSIKLSTASYSYNGKVKTPSVVVNDSQGNKIDSAYYVVTKPSGRKNVGVYTYEIVFKGNYKGNASVTLTITPKKTTLKSPTAAKKAFTAKWTKVTSQVDGYELSYSTTKSFSSNVKNITIDSNKTSSKKITGLNSKKTYYVRIRTYKKITANGKEQILYSGWSSAKKVKTK